MCVRFVLRAWWSWGTCKVRVGESNACAGWRLRGNAGEGRTKPCWENRRPSTERVAVRAAAALLHFLLSHLLLRSGTVCTPCVAPSNGSLSRLRHSARQPCSYFTFHFDVQKFLVLLAPTPLRDLPAPV
jgi:hypothetical protein